ncbi:MAG: hypothetical protein E6I18_16255 [Chloroflexi bacterium]|nr:MAG: hypothetical protein E6I18_16255 [Chloroflexota bacterium]
MSSRLYDPERDRVRIAGRWLRWSLPWIVVPALLGVLVSANLDLRSLPLFGPERLSAVLFLDGQAYFGHLDDSGESGMLVLRDVYYFKNSSGGPTGLAVGLVRRGTEAHEPADGMRQGLDAGYLPKSGDDRRAKCARLAASRRRARPAAGVVRRG